MSSSFLYSDTPGCMGLTGCCGGVGQPACSVNWVGLITWILMAVVGVVVVGAILYFVFTGKDGGGYSGWYSNNQTCGFW